MAAHDDDMVPAAEHRSAVSRAAEAARAEGFAAGKAEGVAEGSKAERERSAAILGSEEAKGREAMAQTLVSQGIAAEAAVAILAASPKGTVATIGERAAAVEAASLSPVTGAAAGTKPATDKAPAVASYADVYASRRATVADRR